MSSAKGIEVAKAVKTFLSSTKSFDQCLNKVNLVTAGEGRMLAEFRVSAEHLNQAGSLHGGFVAMLVDAVSTYALRTNERVLKGGVSVELQVRYLSAAKEGDNVEVEASTVKAGRTLAFLEVKLRNKDSRAIIATGNHTKYLG